MTQPTGSEPRKPAVASIDDFSPATRHDVAQLTQAVEALRTEVAAAMPREEAERKAEELARIRRRTVITMLVAIAIAIAGSIGIDNYAIRRCFFYTPMRHSTFCSVLFPGYNGVVDQSNARLGQFEDLLAGIPANERRIEKLEADVARLKAENERLKARLNDRLEPR